MKKELQDKLFKEFPLLYGDKDKPMTQTCMCWGIDCYDGWFDLLYELSSKLEPLIQKLIDDEPDMSCTWCGKKKSEHDDNDCHGPNGYEPFYPRASQVKEKFGTLSFYMTCATDEMWDLIHEAEGKSGTICEKCGKPGKTVAPCGWYFTFCKDCEEEYKKERESVK